MRGPTKKVWVQVEVADFDPNTGRGNREPVVVGGVDIDAARGALHDLYRLHVDAPSELFNEKNDMYTAPRRLWDVIREDYKKDPQELKRLMIDRQYARIVPQTTVERAEQYKRDHPKEYAAAAKIYETTTPLDTYLAVRKARIEASIDRLLTSKSITEPGNIRNIAKWVGCSAEELADATRGDDDAPFVSEAFLYTLLGKDAARSVRSYVADIAKALGMDEYQMMTTKSPWEKRMDGETDAPPSLRLSAETSILLTDHKPLTVHVGGMELTVVESETQVALMMHRDNEGTLLVHQSWDKAEPDDDNIES